MPVILLSFFLFLAPAQVQQTAPGQNPSENQNQTQTAPGHTRSANATASKAEIRKAQQALKDKGMYMGAIDGRMNADTETALRTFQQQNKLQVTGNLDRETMSALGITHRQSPNEPAAKRQRSSQGKGVQGTSSLSKSSDVRQAQTALKQEGFNPGPIDGIMGPMTATAIRNYQSHLGLQVTGTLTPETQQSLLSGGAATASARLKPEVNSQNQGTYQGANQSVYQGGNQAAVSNSGDISRAQMQLSDLYYYSGPISGTMSPETQQAIREFQYLNDLPVTGSLDQQTQMAISSQWKGEGQNGQLSQTYGQNQQSFDQDQNQSQNQTGQYESSQNQTFDQNRNDQQDQSSIENSQRSYDQSDNQDVNRTKPGVQSDRDSSADAQKHADKSDSSTAEERISKSVDVLKGLTTAGDNSIPNYVLDQAEAIAVIPHMVKGALGFGGRYGGGVVSQRMANGSWSAPAFIQVGGGSWGAQIGVSSTDLVLVFTDRKALDMLEGGNGVKLGADVAAVAGPIGRSAEAGVTGNLKSGVLAYSRAKGLFIGAAVDGAVLHMDKDLNQKVYGQSVDGKEILNGNVRANSTVHPFIAELQRLMPAKKLSQR